MFHAVLSVIRLEAVTAATTTTTATTTHISVIVNKFSNFTIAPCISRLCSMFVTTNKKAIATNQPAISNCYLSPACVRLRRKIASSSSIEGKEDRQKKITELHENISRKFIQVLSRCKAYFERNTHVSHTSNNAAPSLNDAHSIRNVLQCQHIRCKTPNSTVCLSDVSGSKEVANIFFKRFHKHMHKWNPKILIASTCLGFDERARTLVTNNNNGHKRK